MKQLNTFLAICILLIMSCAPYKEFEKTVEHERKVEKVRRQRYKAHSFVGKWQEYKRTLGKNAVQFTDTLRYDFFLDSSVVVYDEYGRMYRTTSGRKKKGFYVGPDNFFKSFYMRDGKMTLGRKRLKHYLYKVDRFHFAELQKATPQLNNFKISPINAAFLKGTWKVYKKTYPPSYNKKTFLYKLDILNEESKNRYNTIAFYDAKGQVVNAQGILFFTAKTRLSIEVMNQVKKYEIIGTDKNELVLQDGIVTYFLKRYNKE